jgi:hypothetical protein
VDLLIFYLNANPTGTPDGLTPTTGYTNFHDLGDDLFEDGNDYIIEIVDNGVLTENESFSTYQNINLTIQSYSGNINKPTWKIVGTNRLVIYGARSVSMYDISVVSDGDTHLKLTFFDNLTDNLLSTVSRCSFLNTSVFFECEGFGGIGTITNCVFSGSQDVDTEQLQMGGVWIGDEDYGRYPANSTITFTAVNNTFYNGGKGGILFSANGSNMIYQVKALNNIYHTVLSGIVINDITFSGSTVSTNFDYNDFYNVTSPDYDGLHSIVGDPLFISLSDFHLQIGSPCIGSGISHSSDVSVPTIDYESTTRINSDIGAYGDLNTSPSSSSDSSHSSQSSWSYSFTPGTSPIFKTTGWTRRVFHQGSQEITNDPKGILKVYLDIVNAQAITGTKY